MRTLTNFVAYNRSETSQKCNRQPCEGDRLETLIPLGYEGLVKFCRALFFVP